MQPSRRAILALLLLSAAGCVAPATQGSDALDPASLPLLAEVDPRFQSYNVEMVEVTGGRFWAPYDDANGETYQYRPPMDLADQRLRNLAANLAPAYVRVSGTWANNTYVPLAGEVLDGPPDGFNQVLTHDQWRGLVQFAEAMDAPIVTSFAAGAGTRDEAGRWTSEQAQRFLDLTTAVGGSLFAAEFINEPSLVETGELPSGYDSEAFAADFATFNDWADSAAPGMLILGPGNLSEAALGPIAAENLLAPGGVMSSERLIAATGGALDVVSWHFYGGSSPRCGGARGLDRRDAILDDAWLDFTLVAYDEIRALRDEHAPGKPLWLSETAQAACGGSPWAASFADTFRYLNQNGLLAQRGVQVVMHNTLAASDYGLLDEDTLAPRPNYWGAVLWQRLMGPIVLATPQDRVDGLRVYAHCLPDLNGGVGLLAINAGEQEQTLAVAGEATAYVMQANDIYSEEVRVNGAVPQVDAVGRISGLAPHHAAGNLLVPARSIAFLSVPEAENPVCRSQ